MYRPLPDCLRVGDSQIDGVGIIAVEDVAANRNLGATHYPRAGQLHGFIRTPLGGFLNHSDTPNSTKVEVDGVLYLMTLRGIESGEELTIRYTLYDTSTLESDAESGRKAQTL